MHSPVSKVLSSEREWRSVIRDLKVLNQHHDGFISSDRKCEKKFQWYSTIMLERGHSSYSITEIGNEKNSKIIGQGKEHGYVCSHLGHIGVRLGGISVGM